MNAQENLKPGLLRPLADPDQLVEVVGAGAIGRAVLRIRIIPEPYPYVKEIANSPEYRKIKIKLGKANLIAFIALLFVQIFLVILALFLFR